MLHFLTARRGTLFLVLAGVLAAASGAQAQQATGSSLGDQENLRLLAGGNGSAAVVTVDKRYEGVHGTPYILPTWSTGDILLSTNQRVVGVPLKYDVLNQQLMARRPQGDSIWVNLSNIKEFTLQETSALPGQPSIHRFRLFKAMPEQGLPAGFLEVLHDAGPYVLLKRSGKSLLKASYQGAYSANRPYDELTTTTEYYLLSPDGRATVVKPASRSLLAAVPAALQEPLRTELRKIALRTETDLYNAVSHLNTLATAR